MNGQQGRLAKSNGPLKSERRAGARLATVLAFFAIGCLARAGSAEPVPLSTAAIDRTKASVRYDGRYVRIDYPGGDVPANIGVCTDVVIRAYRAIGIDLQVLVHEDMTIAFNDYPSQRIWGLSKPDSNIDHRRVPNLRTFFARQGAALPVTDDPTDYAPGDLVTWMLPNNRPHIGIVTHRIDERTGRPLIAHNIGLGPKLEDVLFVYRLTGHYRFEVSTDE